MSYKRHFFKNCNTGIGQLVVRRMRNPDAHDLVPKWLKCAKIQPRIHISCDFILATIFGVTCFPKLFRMFSEAFPNVFRSFSECFPKLFPMFSEAFPNVFRSFSEDSWYMLEIKFVKLQIKLYNQVLRTWKHTLNISLMFPEGYPKVTRRFSEDWNLFD